MVKHMVDFVISTDKDKMTIEMAATVMELCAAHRVGIHYLGESLEPVTMLLLEILTTQGMDSEATFKSLTVLLDISASEDLIEELSQLLIRREEDTVTLMSKFWTLFETQKHQKLLDLFVGLLLNIACNLMDEETLLGFLKLPFFVEYLLRVLIDSQKAWPICGAALAFVQLGHLAAKN